VVVWHSREKQHPQTVEGWIGLDRLLNFDAF
jgi:hypothetical protein